MHSLYGGVHYKDAPFVFNTWQPLCSLFIELVLLAVADLEEGPGGPATPPPLFWVRKEETTEGKMAGMASKSRHPPPPPPPPSLSSRSGSATLL